MVNERYMRLEDHAAVSVVGTGLRGVRLRIQRGTSWFTWWVTRETLATRYERIER